MDRTRDSTTSTTGSIPPSGAPKGRNATGRTGSERSAPSDHGFGDAGGGNARELAESGHRNLYPSETEGHLGLELPDDLEESAELAAGYRAEEAMRVAARSDQSAVGREEMPPDDAVIVLLRAARKQAVDNAEVEAARRALIRRLGRLHRDVSRCEDLLHDVYLKFTKLPAELNPDKPIALFARIAGTTYIDTYRRTRKEGQAPESESIAEDAFAMGRCGLWLRSQDDHVFHHQVLQMVCGALELKKPRWQPDEPRSDQDWLEVAALVLENVVPRTRNNSNEPQQLSEMLATSFANLQKAYLDTNARRQVKRALTRAFKDAGVDEIRGSAR